ncbi:hypothetical protein GCM10010219_39250 [Streptomyces netropsis]|nr:hypothetical protein GCM10010219_39250 [Streptomyces netropsis]
MLVAAVDGSLSPVAPARVGRAPAGCRGSDVGLILGGRPADGPPRGYRSVMPGYGKENRP